MTTGKNTNITALFTHITKAPSSVAPGEIPTIDAAGIEGFRVIAGDPEALKDFFRRNWMGENANEFMIALVNSGPEGRALTVAALQTHPQAIDENFNARHIVEALAPEPELQAEFLAIDDAAFYVALSDDGELLRKIVGQYNLDQQAKICRADSALSGLCMGISTELIGSRKEQGLKEIAGIKTMFEQFTPDQKADALSAKGATTGFVKNGFGEWSLQQIADLKPEQQARIFLGDDANAFYSYTTGGFENGHDGRLTDGFDADTSSKFIGLIEENAHLYQGMQADKILINGLKRMGLYDRFAKATGHVEVGVGAPTMAHG